MEKIDKCKTQDSCTDTLFANSPNHLGSNDSTVQYKIGGQLNTLLYIFNLTATDDWKVIRSIKIEIFNQFLSRTLLA